MKSERGIWHAAASDQQPSPEPTSMEKQSLRRPSAGEKVSKAKARLVLLDTGASIGLVPLRTGRKGGAVTRMVPVKLVLLENPVRHSAFDHD